MERQPNGELECCCNLRDSSEYADLHAVRAHFNTGLALLPVPKVEARLAQREGLRRPQARPKSWPSLCMFPSGSHCPFLPFTFSPSLSFSFSFWKPSLSFAFSFWKFFLVAVSFHVRPQSEVIGLGNSQVAVLCSGFGVKEKK